MSRFPDHRSTAFTVSSQFPPGLLTPCATMSRADQGVSGAHGSMAKSRILVVEDERSLAEVLTYNLEREGFEVMVARDGSDALRQAQVKLPDLVVLDMMLPLKPGLEVCRELRAAERTRTVPIVMLTAKAEETDELIGLTMGADDYVTKPFSMKVLLERIKKQLRRGQDREELLPGLLIECHGVVIDRHRHRALFQDEELPLTPTEFRLLETLLRQPGRAFTRFELMDSAIGENAVVLERTIDVHIKSLRRKLGEASGLLETVRGLGYRFREADSETSA
jgi:two-component system, OmpR family, phosphate regulon response regulator PhoB